jgi:regulator of sigma E protease
MMATLSAIFWGILTFSILVVLHEGGHFAVARAFGVKVHEFMLGLPGPAIRWQGKNTTFGVTAIPLGGYVRIAGMEPGPEDPRLADALAFVTKNRETSAVELSDEFGYDLSDAEGLLVTLADWGAINPPPTRNDSVYSAIHPAALAQDPVALLDVARTITYRGLSTWKRIAVLSAGVLVNLASAVLVFVLVLTLYGVPSQTLRVDIAAPTGAAAAAGIISGDTVSSINGKKLAEWNDLISTLGTFKPGDQVTVVVDRVGSPKTFSVTLGRSETGDARLGIQVATENVRMAPGAALKESFMWIGLVFKAIGGFFNPGTFKQSVSGSMSVVGVSVEVSRAVQRGPIDYAFLVALLSLSLGVMNILPIPPLDGGKVALEIIEGVTRRQIPRKVAYGLSLTGALLLFSFIGYLMYADVVKFIVKGG